MDATARLEAATQRLQLLHDLARRLSRPLDRRQLLDEIVTGARWLLGVPYAAVLTREEGGAGLAVESVSSDLQSAELPVSDLELAAAPALATGETVILDDLRAHPQASALARGLELVTVAAAPLPRGGADRPADVLFVARRAKADRDELRGVLELVASIAGMALAGGERIAATARRLARIEQLAVAGRGLIQLTELDDVLAQALEVAIDLFGADRAAIYLVDDNERPTLCAARRLSRPYIEEVAKRYRQSAGGLVLVVRAPIYVADLATDARARAMNELAAIEGIHTALMLPLLDGSHIVGVLVLYHDTVWPYDPSELGPLRAFSEDLALALGQHQRASALRREIERLGAVDAVARAMLEPAEAVERARRGAQAMVQAGLADAVWVTRSEGSTLRVVAEAGAATVAADCARSAAQAALLAGRAISRTVGGAQVIAAPLPGADAAIGALTFVARPAPTREPPPEILHVPLSREEVPSPALEIGASLATLFAAPFRQAASPAVRVR